MQFLEQKEIRQYIMEAENLNDFLSRMNGFIQIITHELSNRFATEVNFHYDVVKIVDEMDTEIQSVLDFINARKLINDQPVISKNFIMEIIDIAFPQYHDMYMYQKHYIKN